MHTPVFVIFMMDRSDDGDSCGDGESESDQELDHDEEISQAVLIRYHADRSTDILKLNCPRL